MVISVLEVIDMLIMTGAVGYIFMDIFKIPRLVTKGFDWRSFGLACLVTAPALILHELAHKFVAIAFGAQATFHAAYLFLALGIVLKLLRSPFLFFVPGFVSIPIALPMMPLALTAFAGPGVNGVLYLVSIFVMKKFRLSKRAELMWFFTRRINGLLFLLNMIPIPGFDGFQVFRGLFGAF